MKECFICTMCQWWQFVKELTNWRRVSVNVKQREKLYLYLENVSRCIVLFKSCTVERAQT